MYVHSDPVDQKKGDTRKLGGNSSRRSYGRGRLQTLKRGTSACTGLERQWMHWAFQQATNSSWAQAVSKDQLVELPFEEILKIGSERRLPWPDGLPNHLMFKALASSYPSTLSIEMREWPKRVAGRQNSVRHDLRREPPEHALPVGYEFSLNVSGIRNPGQSSLLVFEVCDKPVILGEQDTLIDTFVCRLLDSDDSVIEFGDRSDITLEDDPFIILDFKGVFTYYALALPRSSNLEQELGADLSSYEWGPSKTKSFLEHLKRILESEEAGFQIASYTYEVI